MAMYNRYIPQETSYTWVGPARETQKKEKTTSSAGGPSKGLGGWFSFLTEHSERGGTGVSCVNTLRSGIRTLWDKNSFDSGDLLLILILLLLLKEGEDSELIFMLGVMILFGLGDDREKDTERKTGDG